jgi:ABC-type uncharacterized transport system permease subunit
MFWTAYILYLIFFVSSGVAGWQLQNIALTYVIVFLFAALTWRVMSMPFHQDEEALSEAIDVGYWRKALTLSITSTVAVLFSGLLLAH